MISSMWLYMMNVKANETIKLEMGKKFFRGTLPSTMRFPANRRLHPTPGGLMQIVSCGCPQGLLFEGGDRPPDRV